MTPLHVFRLRIDGKISESAGLGSHFARVPQGHKASTQGEDIMMICSSAPRSVLLAGAFVGLFTFGAVAQQPADPAPAATAAPALPPGSPLIGRPASEAAAKLAPVAPAPRPAAPDKLPTAKLKVPPGFNIEGYAAGMANAPALAEGYKGTVFVGSRLVDKVYAVVNKDGKRSGKVLASVLYLPTSLAFNTATLS